ncbi:MAG TPA: DUF418 domain-containing protein [Chitinophagaceae bacterium]|nr:DUF418 domain-containing protein [Chitinophagaceae bacterium]
MRQDATPVLGNERADILDVLRGFALFGVLLDNIFGFTGWGFLPQQGKEALATWPADAVIGMLEQVFINGKFYSLFSLLFGLGFSIILVRNEQRGINPLKIFYRRLFILLIIGAGHLFLLWEGDILFLYALIGFTLPLFRKLSDKTLITLAVILIASPLLFDLLSVIFHYKNGQFLEKMAIAVDKKTGLPTDDSFASYLYRDGAGWQEWRNWQASGYLYRYSYILDSNRIPKVLGMFLIGFYAGRKMIYMRLEDHVPLFKKLRRWGLIIGIPSAAAGFYFEFFQKHIPEPQGLLHTLFYATSVVPLCLAYASIICLRWIKKKGNTRLKVLAPMGRMALTNYLMQTIIGITLYYGVGFGFGGNIGPAVFVPIGLAVYALQVAYSNLWFRYFNYGPMEWIWRQLTYGKRLPLRKRVDR